MAPEERTRVYLTFDVEGAEPRVIGGQPWPAQGYDARVWGRFANQRRELGLRFILDELEDAGLRGTFFLETCGAEVFGQDQLAEVCQEMRGRGHDVQLHLHPVQRRDGAGTSDFLCDYSEDEQAALIAQGIQTLVDCGVPRPSLVAFRAGHFAADNRTWSAMARHGLRVASNYNPCYFHRCKVRHPGAAPELFAGEAGVWELPVTSFVELGGGHRHLQLTAISLREMCALIMDARRAGLREITIVSHTFELFTIDSITERRGRPNNVNRWRLRGLCQFLAQHAGELQVETVGALGSRLAAAVAPPRAPAPGPATPLRGRLGQRLERLAEQALKRLEARLPLGVALVRDRRKG